MTDPNPPLPGPKTMKAQCAQCAGIRNCDVQGEYRHSYDDDYVHGGTAWRILQCRGCEYVFIQTERWFSEDPDYGTDDYEGTIEYWPALSKRKMPEWIEKPEWTGQNLDGVTRLEDTMFEIYGALHNDLRVLAAIGIRTAFDIAAELLGINSRLSFAEKLDTLVSSERIGSVEKDRLQVLVEAGNASAHRGWKPTPADLNTMMDVLEHFISASFVVPARQKQLDAKAAKVKETVPSKTKVKPSTPDGTAALMGSG